MGNMTYTLQREVDQQNECIEKVKEMRRQSVKAILRFIMNELKLKNEHDALKHLAASMDTTAVNIRYWKTAGVPEIHVKAVIKCLNEIKGIKWAPHQIRPTEHELSGLPLIGLKRNYPYPPAFSVAPAW